VRNRRLQRGVTLIETMMAAVITGLTLITGVGIFFVGMFGWLTGEGQLDSEETSHTAIQAITNELRQAVVVGVDANGLGLTYALPLQQNGTDVYPETTDGLTRRIELDGTKLNIIGNGVTNTLCTNVTTTDPSTGARYALFTPGAGTNPHALTVEICTTSPGDPGINQLARNRDSIYLRNVPQIVQ